ncbi:restriction endonuclease [Candidatus Pacearchaeota archaeon]|nr:restriction endonuclease [Candidatus Pacearchaeota archaeon]
MKNKSLNLDSLDGYEFQELITKIMQKRGYKQSRATPKSKDLGKDIIMENQKGDAIIIECKHQNLVGRPVIQKLQGAMSHEEKQEQKNKVKGIIVTSGSFSKDALEYVKEIHQEIELIDGKKLKDLCKELKVIIENGKVQVITNKSFRNLSEKNVKETILKEFSKIYWSKECSPKIKINFSLNPVIFIEYDVNFNTHTSVGCIDRYSKKGEMGVEGVTGKVLYENLAKFFLSGDIDLENIKNENTKIQFELSEDEIEDNAINYIISEHTHDVYYTGNNNRGYQKTCIPKKRDISIKQVLPVYIPNWRSQISLMKMDYSQRFYIKGEKWMYLEDELKKCKICGEENNYKKLSLCPDCGRVVCENHRIIDYLDKKTPVCELHIKPFRLWIQKRNFAKKENLEEYKKWWMSRNFLQKLYEDKIALGFAIGITTLLILWLI